MSREVIEGVAMFSSPVHLRFRAYSHKHHETHCPTEGYYWLRQGIMIRVDMRYTANDHSEQRIVMELHDLKIGPQDPAHFELPRGLRDLTNNIELSQTPSFM
jgi:hypothetical protein